ncbi:hypothetical protein [Pusillimonas sp.]
MTLAGFACLTSMHLCDALLPDIARNLSVFSALRFVAGAAAAGIVP